MAEYAPETLLRLQKTELRIARAFFDFCRSHGLPAVSLYGTALGAVRHQGFIPWDDDMDVGMPREAYNRLLALRERLPEGLELLCPEHTSGYALTFAKLCLKNTTFTEASHPERTWHCGIYIDIYPLDFAPEDEKEQRRLLRRCYLHARFMSLAESGKPVLPEGTKGVSAALLRIACRLGHRILRALGQNRGRIYRRYLAAASSCPDRGLLMDAADLCPMDTVIAASVLFPPAELPFMDTSLPMPADSDTYLKTYYHDYMRLPAPEERHNHPPAVLLFEEDAP